MVRLIGPALVVEVVQQRDDAPVLLVLADQPGVAAHGRLDGQHVLPQAFALGVFLHQRERVGAGQRHGLGLLRPPNGGSTFR